MQASLAAARVSEQPRGRLPQGRAHVPAPQRPGEEQGPLALTFARPRCTRGLPWRPLNHLRQSRAVKRSFYACSAWRPGLGPQQPRGWGGRGYCTPGVVGGGRGAGVGMEGGVEKEKGDLEAFGRGQNQSEAW